MWCARSRSRPSTAPTSCPCRAARRGASRISPARTTEERTMPTIGILHPGDMGSVVGACAVAAGGRVLWASAGRSAGSRERAAAAGLEDADTVDALVAASDVIVSVCPPHAALDLARDVAGGRPPGVPLR